MWFNPDGKIEADPKGNLPDPIRAAIIRNLADMKTYLGAHATMPTAPETFDDYVRECEILRDHMRAAFPWPDVRIDDNDIEFLKKHYQWLKAESAKPPVKVRAEAMRRLWEAEAAA